MNADPIRLPLPCFRRAGYRPQRRASAATTTARGRATTPEGALRGCQSQLGESDPGCRLTMAACYHYH
jgi:hypothetical protein